MTDLELLSQRLLNLESKVRRMKRFAGLLVLMIVAGALLAKQNGDVLPNGVLIRRTEGQTIPAKTVESEVRAQHFILVDTKGKERASLVADQAGSVFLVLFDAKEKNRLQLSVGNEGPSLTLHDASGQARAILGSTSVVASHVNDNGIAERSPASSIVLFDRSGKFLWRTP